MSGGQAGGLEPGDRIAPVVHTEGPEERANGWGTRLYPVGALGGLALTLAGVMAMGLALWIDHQMMASVAALLVAPDYGWRVFGMYYAGGIGLAARYMTLAASCDWWPLRSSRQL